jgi:hypothetical protein
MTVIAGAAPEGLSSAEMLKFRGLFDGAGQKLRSSVAGR